VNPNPSLKAAGESEVWNAIAAFERILEAMPNDRVALETLSDAYEQIGQSSRAVEYMLRLGQTILDENDADGAPKVMERLRRVRHDDPAVVEMISLLQDLHGEAPAHPDEAEGEHADAKRRTVDITSELALAWNLLQAGELSQDQYSSVVHDLSESSTQKQDTPVTVLHMLQGRGFANLEKVVAFLSKDSHTPVLNLSSFELQKKAVSLLSDETMTKRGAIVFELMGNDALVAVLNPYDKALREHVKGETSRQCHYYLVTPSDYDRTLNDIQSNNQEAA
jgi:hypothetical protein